MGEIPGFSCQRHVHVCLSAMVPLLWDQQGQIPTDRDQCMGRKKVINILLSSPVHVQLK